MNLRRTKRNQQDLATFLVFFTAFSLLGIVRASSYETGSRDEFCLLFI